jgi:serine/threonine protein kinase
VRLYFTFQDCNSLYLGMEPCAGGELFDQIRRRKPRGLPTRAARFYAAELLDILQGGASLPTSEHIREHDHRDSLLEQVQYMSNMGERFGKQVEGVSCERYLTI